MLNLVEIQSQIEKLQKQASEIKAKEFHSTVQDILVKMQAFGITAKDLQSARMSRAGKARRGRPVAGAKPTKVVKVAKVGKVAQKAGAPVAAKYRGPQGETWSGRGLTPKWLAALVAGGQSKESFLISV